MKTEYDKVKRRSGRLLPLCLLSFLSLSATAQTVLSLDSCRAMALRNNKQLGVSQIKQDVARNLRKSARTKYLPHVSAWGTYQYTSEAISILNDDQKSRFSNMGTNAQSVLQQGMSTVGTTIGQFGQLLSPLGQIVAPLGVDLNQSFAKMSQELQQQMQQGSQGIVGALNQKGQEIVDAFETDTRNLFAGSIVVTQPVFMGGAIIAMNKLADQHELMQQNSADARRQAVLYAIDQAYWQVVSLNHKKRLAESYTNLVKKLDGDVQKMIDEGVATRSDGLSVSVKVNEAEMALQKVENGLTLSKMLLCQLIGLPSDTPVTLTDEEKESLEVVDERPQLDIDAACDNRPELKMLDNGVEMARQVTNIMKAGNLPQVALMGGYAVTNPSVFNGFEKKFRGFWNVGVLVRVPIWNWGDVMYKVRASKGAAAIASLEREEAREKIELQLNQTSFKVDEANKRLAMAESNIQKAAENLRMAELGFSEGVISPTVVMEAQTAWLQAQSQKIDAQIGVLLSRVDLRKAQGTLGK